MYVYVYICICVYVYIHVNAYPYAYTCICEHICVGVYVYVHMYTYMQTYIHMHIHVPVIIYVFVYICTVYVCVYIYIYTCIYLYVPPNSQNILRYIRGLPNYSCITTSFGPTVSAFILTPMHSPGPKFLGRSRPVRARWEPPASDSRELLGLVAWILLPKRRAPKDHL